MPEENENSQTFTYVDGTSSTWTRDGDRYFKDGVEMGQPADLNSATDGWGEYFRDYQRHIHRWEPLPNSQQETHILKAWAPPRRDND